MTTQEMQLLFCLMCSEGEEEGSVVSAGGGGEKEDPDQETRGKIKRRQEIPIGNEAWPSFLRREGEKGRHGVRWEGPSATQKKEGALPVQGKTASHPTARGEDFSRDKGERNFSKEDVALRKRRGGGLILPRERGGLRPSGGGR